MYITDLLRADFGSGALAGLVADPPMVGNISSDPRFGDGSGTRFGPIGGIRYIGGSGTSGLLTNRTISPGGPGGAPAPQPAPAPAPGPNDPTQTLASAITDAGAAGDTSGQGIYIPPGTPSSASSSSNVIVGVVALATVIGGGWFAWQHFHKKAA